MELAATGRLLGHLIEKAEHSQRSFATQVGTSVHTINRLVRGTTTACRGDVGTRIEQALGVPHASLFRDTSVSHQKVSDAGQRAA